MTSYILNYWWGSSIGNHKIHWLKWSNLTRLKGTGGMGFRDLSLFNQALLGKQAWRLVTTPESLCSRVIKGKYFPQGNLLSTTRRKNSSVTWKAILHGREVLQKGIIKRIGDGSSIDVWNDKWIPGSVSMKPMVRLDIANAIKVADLIDERRQWKVEVLKNFVQPDIDAILKIKLGQNHMEDLLAWGFEKNGNYSVRSAYRLLKDILITEENEEEHIASSSDGSGSWWKFLWKMKIPPKIKIFWWRVIHGFFTIKGDLAT
uniref:Reverse transcriptase zinc-binding domain-containing protein n=1 Tax=Arundo donax TaxID=35708 RepID=A0A0A9CKU8_ARUDO